MDWFQIGKGIRQGCILTSCLFNLYVEYIMGNARLDEAQAGIKIAGRNINNLRQYIKKQKHYFADKGLYSQSYGFSSSQSCMDVRAGP